jgi:hypothetical protein
MSEEQNNILKRLLKPTRPVGTEEQVISRSEQRSETSSTGGSTASEGDEPLKKKQDYKKSRIDQHLYQEKQMKRMSKLSRRR